MHTPIHPCIVQYMSTEQQYTEAVSKVTELRAAYAAARVGSRQWRALGEELDWWVGRKAFLGGTR